MVKYDIQIKTNKLIITSTIGSNQLSMLTIVNQKVTTGQKIGS